MLKPYRPVKKSELIERIKRVLGYPVVKVELDDMQIADHIDYARQKFIKWAIGQGVIERYFTIALSAGVTDYELPGDVTEVLSYDTRTTGSIHTLFTVENYLYNAGMYDMLLMRGGGSGYTLVSYHIARDFLDTIRRYVFDTYNFTYHRYTNILEIQPPPPSGGTIYWQDTWIDSPGYILVRAYVLEGTEEDLYDNMWIFDYACALSKRTLGRIRSKFANFTAIGQTGLALDGDTLLSEAQTEIEKLEEQLRTEEPWEGLGIYIG